MRRNAPTFACRSGPAKQAPRLYSAGLSAIPPPQRNLPQFPHRTRARDPRVAQAELGATTEFPLLPVLPPALLALADGTVFQGSSIGAAGETVGEVVFNTALTGYQEILTDPSYCKQIVTLTYPHIGNYGINAEDVEATRVHAAGL